MTSPDPDLDARLATDTRRASVLMAHHIEDNAQGVAAILQEAAEQGRSIDLVIALADLALFCSPLLRQPDAADALRAGAAKLATRERS